MASLTACYLARAKPAGGHRARISAALLAGKQADEPHLAVVEGRVDRRRSERRRHAQVDGDRARHSRCVDQEARTLERITSTSSNSVAGEVDRGSNRAPYDELSRDEPSPAELAQDPVES